MHTTLADSIRVYIIRNKNRKWLRRLVSVLACAVVFFTTYALILPAITLEQEAFCGLEEHTHTEDCYAWQTQQKNLICSADALGIHAHSAECYTADNILICGQADYVAHSHDDSCVDSQGAVVCTLEERSAHVHGESCYAAAETEKRLYCTFTAKPATACRRVT